ncbi:MAG: hypothetical protein JSR54_07280, partial [Proteobacteria bacterium]|nr:hypothetical protein [Pseudomonadota bacterium]
HGAVQTLAAQALAGGRAPAAREFGVALGRALGLADALAAPGRPLLAGFDVARLAHEARAVVGHTTEATGSAHGSVRASLVLARLDSLGGASPSEPSALTLLWRAWRTARATARRRPESQQ